MKNFIWDFDGTLFDSYHHTTAAFVKALGEPRSEAEYNEIKRALEESIIYAIDKYNLSENEVKLFFEYEYDYDMKPVTEPYSYTRTVLEEIVRNGGYNYLYTHRNTSVFYYLDKYEMRDYFTDFITKESGFPMKPSPAALNNLTQRYQMNKDETIMIGDREIDVLAGKNAGLNALLISERNIPSCADYIVKDISEVISFIDNGVNKI